MTFSSSRFLLCSLLVCVAAWAEDKPGKSQTASDSIDIQAFASDPSDSAHFNLYSLTNPFGEPNSIAAGTQVRDRGARFLADRNGEVCYTMRSYKVKRTERLKDDESGRRGYTTCEMASEYSLRSADAKVLDDTSRPK